MNETIVILLSTYNGEAYIEEQIKSIQQQTYQNWLLFIRDDGSTDNTVALIQALAEQDPRIVLHMDTLGNILCPQSFSHLMGIALSNTSYNYFAFCDQDDVWLDYKLEQSLKQLRAIENKQTKKLPILVHSDLLVTDDNLSELNDSYYRFEHKFPRVEDPLSILLIYNYVVGNTALFNRSVLELAYPVPKEVHMHDWWCALVAGAKGQVHYLSTKTVLYRQHSKNYLGVKQYYRNL